jgi:hypothetical protein
MPLNLPPTYTHKAMKPISIDTTNMTDAQKESLFRVIAHQGHEHYRSCYADTLLGCVIARFTHITIGIEPDGYAHS